MDLQTFLGCGIAVSQAMYCNAPQAVLLTDPHKRALEIARLERASGAGRKDQLIITAGALPVATGFSFSFLLNPALIEKYVSRFFQQRLITFARIRLEFNLLKLAVYPLYLLPDV
ncbi:hypothetical protein ADL05_06160 [Nocardiopsis sp. NRRL B-16309]|nr:hypothetical protein ADL05_06160 [Nocardiopsis sp. NRRL B-16309]